LEKETSWGAVEAKGREAARTEGYTPGSRRLPSTQLKQNPDWVWTLKTVVRPRPDGKDRFDFRVFDQAQVAAKKVTVKDYNSLDEHPNLILYEGWFDKKSMRVEIEDKKAA